MKKFYLLSLSSLVIFTLVVSLPANLLKLKPEHPQTSTPAKTLEPSKPEMENLPFSNSAMIFDSQRSIELSHALLIQKGYETGLSYDNASSTLITFPNGDKGMFVTFGFSGITRGYKILYRFKELGDPFTIVFAKGNRVDAVGCGYGYDAFNDKKQEVEFVRPFLNNPEKVLLKISCSRHPGSGMFTNTFELIDFDDTGEKVVFQEENYAHLITTDDTYRYTFKDIDNDGVLDITKSGTHCQKELLTSKITSCEDVKQTYKFIGEKFEVHSFQK